MKKLTRDMKGVKAIAWDKSGKYFVATCKDQNHTAYCIKPKGKKGKILAKAKTGGPIFDITFGEEG